MVSGDDGADSLMIATHDGAFDSPSVWTYTLPTRRETGTCLTWRQAVEFSSVAPPPRVSVKCAQASRVTRRRFLRVHLFLLDLVDPDLVTYQDNDDLAVFLSLRRIACST
ncbi:hypothetical protein PsorP6_012885 [Peronosclerospora sorghi]|uniref:Uncharacterized protein n=1 Tax=Peronosclerospora sorghi TaxID=230839 RepID=A0ACC0WEX1_9STRA|nr:hypothetical protein PsorP6_012885 [Peronosclerospora sorghi]